MATGYPCVRMCMCVFCVLLNSTKVASNWVLWYQIESVFLVYAHQKRLEEKKNKTSIFLPKLPHRWCTKLPVSVRLWDDSSERQHRRRNITTNFSVSHYADWKYMYSCSLMYCCSTAFYDCSSYQSSHKQGCWFCVCMSYGLLSHVENTVSTLGHHHPSESVHTYYTVACFISILFCKVFILTEKVGLCPCVQGVMQDVEILVMPQGYISQCPDLNRSESLS